MERALGAAVAAVRAAALGACACVALAIGACGGGLEEATDREHEGEVADEAEWPLVVFLGDSLTAGYGLPEEQAFPALLEARAALDGRPFRAINGGVSGDTSRGGASRLDWFLRQEPDVVVVALGANDGLRGLPLEQLEANLRDIVERASAAGALVLLAGQRVPPSLGFAYARDFAEIYERLADELDVELVPFLLDGVGGVRSLNQGDGLHPNARGQERLAENVWPKLSRLLDRADG